VSNSVSIDESMVLSGSEMMDIANRKAQKTTPRAVLFNLLLGVFEVLVVLVVTIVVLGERDTVP